MVETRNAFRTSLGNFLVNGHSEYQEGNERMLLRWITGRKVLRTGR
jgi:hypothetical protein